MNLFALSLAAAVAVAAGASLRGDFARDVVPPARRDLRADCVARSSYVGCYGDRKNDRALPHAVKGQGHDAETCEAACADEGYAYFGREYRGQCFCGHDAGYAVHGAERDCDCCNANVGSNKMCVWRINDVAPGCRGDYDDTAYLGCYADRNSHRVLSRAVDGRRDAGDCRAWCQGRDYEYFGREWRGQCFCGNREDYHRHESATDCDCCGRNVGSHKICVWRS